MQDITIIHRKLVVAGLVSFTAAAAAGHLMIEATGAQDGALTRDRPMIIAQAGFTFGSRDDLGPRYDPYPERWDQYKPTGPYTCRWVPMRTRLPDGRMVLRRQRLCGFKVRARD